MTTVQVAVRLPKSQLGQIDALVGHLHESRSDVLRRALDLYLYQLECERDAAIYQRLPLSADELAFASSWENAPEW